jgi:peptidoglycan/LPS O-acetylase OafA/YrhL
MVMTFHLVGGTDSTNRAIRFFSLLIHGFGWAGVDLFFVLSGFLITGILLDSLDDPHYFRNFYARRTLRIFPLYYGVLAICFGVLPFLVSMDTPNLLWIRHHQLWLWLYGSGLLDGWTGKANFSCDWLWLTHFWSLAVEEHFYLVWPALVLLCARRKALVPVCVTIAAVVLIARLLALHCGVSEITLYVFSPFRVDSLAIGGLVAALARRPAGMRALVAPAFGMLAASFAVIVALTVFGGFANDHTGTARYFTPLALFFASCLVLTTVANPAARGAQGLAGRAIAHPILRFFGRYSYGLYVLEVLMQPLWNRLFRTDEIVRVVHSYLLAGFAHLLLCVGSTLALAILSFHFYEKPFLGLKRYFESRTRAGAPRGVSAGGALPDRIQSTKRHSDMPDLAPNSDEEESLGIAGH